METNHLSSKFNEIAGIIFYIIYNRNNRIQPVLPKVYKLIILFEIIILQLVKQRKRSRKSGKNKFFKMLKIVFLFCAVLFVASAPSKFPFSMFHTLKDRAFSMFYFLFTVKMQNMNSRIIGIREKSRTTNEIFSVHPIENSLYFSGGCREGIAK